MTDILSRILNAKKAYLPKMWHDHSLYQPKPFLKKGVFQIIAEIKRGSPSLGLFKPDLNILETVQYYERLGASALSVLTEADFFYGSLDDLTRVRGFSDKPILRKDFITEESQLYESKAIGADAVLLIVAAMKKLDKLSQLIAVSEKIGLSVLVETHTHDEVSLALAAGARIIGINNRNLKTFDTDLQTSFDLVGQIPDEVIKVSESGVHSREQIDALRSAGFDAVLIGESLLKGNLVL
ncbi:MAG: indole-3-glycerol phosphate synthase TrpC [Candidatus Margulisiibacteriota bacterium]